MPYTHLNLSSVAYCSGGTIVIKTENQSLTTTRVKNDALLHPMHYAIKNSPNYDIIEKLIIDGYDVNAQDGNGDTPLHLLLQQHNMEIAYAISILLLGSGADCNIQNKSGNTPLHYSVLNYKTTRIIELLIEFGANFRIPKLYHVTPKDLVSEYGSTEHESLLIGMQDNDPHL